MYYSVEELDKNLEEKLFELGVDPRFKENPAFEAALSNIKGLILNMGIFLFDKAKNVTVKQEGKGMYFEWISEDGKKYLMNIYSLNPDTFTCVRTEEYVPFVSSDGKTVRSKGAIEEIATIDKYGFITLTENTSFVDNVDCNFDECYNTTHTSKKYYTSKGVMRDREDKGFSRCKIPFSFDFVKAGIMLNTPRNSNNHKYQTRTTLIREKLDTAQMVVEVDGKGVIYSAKTRLDQQHGLRDMEVYTGGSYPQDVVIPPLSQEEIEEMIQRESNPKIAEGLRECAVGRENYYYNSAEDRNFICKNMSNSQGISR